MAGKTAVITLGDTEYIVHRFNLGELEEVTGALANSSAREAAPFKVLAVALKRADPPVQDPNSLEVDAAQIGDAVRVILELAGLQPANPQPAAAS